MKDGGRCRLGAESSKDRLLKLLAVLAIAKED